MKAVLVTGGCGFIGSNFIRHILREREEAAVINIDKLTYTGNPAKVHRELQWEPSVAFERGITDTIEWYLNHMDWVADIESGKYLEYS